MLFVKMRKVWLVRRKNKTIMGNFRYANYRVIRSQNTIELHVGEMLAVSAVQYLCESPLWEVNIIPEPSTEAQTTNDSVTPEP